jgi:hypothetical protein
MPRLQPMEHNQWLIGSTYQGKSAWNLRDINALPEQLNILKEIVEVGSEGLMSTLSHWSGTLSTWSPTLANWPPTSTNKENQ